MCSCCWLRLGKNHNFGQILTCGSYCTDPLLATRAKFSVLPRYTLACQISSLSVYSVTLWQRKPKILPFFWTSVFCGVANLWQQSEKVEHGCTTTNLLLSNGVEIMYSNAFLAKSCAQTDVQKRDEQTNKQTKKLSVFGRFGGG